MSKRPQRLGRGLEALIGTTEFPPVAQEPMPGPKMAQTPAVVPEEPAIPVRMVPVDRIDPNPFQPRKLFDEAALAELAQSIRTDGVLQPIVVRPAGERFQLIAGERRSRAAKLAGLTEMPAVVRETDDKEMLALALIENIQREDLNAIEKAKAYEQLRIELNLPIEHLARRVGQDRSTVSNHLRLLELDDALQSWIRTGALSMGHARAILGAPAEHRTWLGRRVVEQGLTVRMIEKTAQLLRNGGGVPGKKQETRPVVKGVEQRFTQALGMRTRIKESPKGKSGRIVIYYRTLDDFDRICDRLNVPTEEA